MSFTKKSIIHEDGKDDDDDTFGEEIKFRGFFSSFDFRRFFLRQRNYFFFLPFKIKFYFPMRVFSFSAKMYLQQHSILLISCDVNDKSSGDVNPIKRTSLLLSNYIIFVYVISIGMGP